tara:strand:- start:22 stop:501 length:480 start_codon:yes stop_codon:yes gene_type:complete
MENINDVKKIARKFLKKPKVLQMRDTIQVIAISGAYMNLKHTKRGGEYEITDPNDNLIGGGDYDSVLEPFAEFKDLLRSLKLESIKPVVERNQRVFYEGIIDTLFGRVIAGAKPRQVVQQATKNHPELKGMAKQIEKDLEELRKDKKELSAHYDTLALD